MMPVYLRQTFHSIPCLDVHVDAMDVAGENQLGIDHDMFKQRLDPNGLPVGDPFTEIVSCFYCIDKSETVVIVLWCIFVFKIKNYTEEGRATCRTICAAVYFDPICSAVPGMLWYQCLVLLFYFVSCTFILFFVMYFYFILSCTSAVPIWAWSCLLPPRKPPRKLPPYVDCYDMICHTPYYIVL